MKHYLISALLLTMFTIPSLAQTLTCAYIDPICNKALELIRQGQYEQALSGLEEAVKDNGIKNCPDVYKIKDLISEIQTYQASVYVPQTKTYTVNGVSFKMIAVEGGSFDMGSNDGFDNEKPVHRVTLSGYAIGETEVTQVLWLAVMGENPSHFTGDSNLPVEMVSWDDCQTFIDKLNSLTEGQRPAGRKFRLPTEAEWEFAARGGNNRRDTKFSGDDNFSNVGWYWGNSASKTHPVKQKAPNELGLYDMSGNVWEWCQDYFDDSYYSKSPMNNPCNKTETSYRVYRGGSWNNFSVRDCRVSFRWFTSYNRGSDIGLRLAL